MMFYPQYLEVLPAADLFPLVRCFWLAFNDSGSEVVSSTLPDGCFELVISYQQDELQSVRLFGILAQAFDQVVMPAGELKFGIRLWPLGKEYYIDKRLPLERFADFSQNRSGNLDEQLLNFARNVSDDILKTVQFEHIEQWKWRLFQLLGESSGMMNVATIAEKCFWTARQLNRYVQKLLGVSLKSYSNILKCHAAYRIIKGGELHPDTGFYDQSHFIREIKKHTGATPKVLLRNKGHRYLQFNDPAVSYTETQLSDTD